MNTSQTSQKQEEPSKHTVREVFDSLFYEVCDEDGDYDGFLHIVSDINGAQIKIKMDDLKFL